MDKDTEEKIETILSSLTEHRQLMKRKWLKKNSFTIPDKDFGEFTQLYQKKRELIDAKEVFYRKSFELDDFDIYLMTPKLKELLNAEDKVKQVSFPGGSKTSIFIECLKIFDQKQREYEACENDFKTKLSELNCLKKIMNKKRSELQYLETDFYQKKLDLYNFNQ